MIWVSVSRSAFVSVHIFAILRKGFFAEPEPVEICRFPVICASSALLSTVQLMYLSDILKAHIWNSLSSPMKTLDSTDKFHSIYVAFFQLESLVCQTNDHS